MRRNLARARDTLTWHALSGHKEVQRLKQSAQKTELNFRTKPLTDAEERGLALRILVMFGLQCFLFTCMFQLFRMYGCLWISYLMIPTAVAYMLIGCFYWLVPRTTPHTNLYSLILMMLVGFAVSCYLIGRFVTWEWLSSMLINNPFIFVFLYVIFSILGALSVAVSGTYSAAFLWAMRFLLVFFLCQIPPLFAEQTFTYSVTFGSGVLSSLVISHLIALQCGAYFAVNERLTKETSERYRTYLTGLPLVFKLRAPLACYTYCFGYLGILALFVLGYAVCGIVQKSHVPELAGLAGMLAVGVLIPVCWSFLHWRHTFEQAFRVCYLCLVTFLVYNRHDTTAAGVFRFPSRWLRHVPTRQRLIGAAVMLFLISVLALGPPPAMYYSPEEPEYNKLYVITEEHKATAARLPEVESNRYLEAVESENKEKAEQARKVWKEEQKRKSESNGDSIVLVLAATGVLSLVLPVGLFCLIFTFTAGGLLCAFYDALEAEDAWEVQAPLSKEELQSGNSHVPNAWDNKIERILTSANADEAEHFYLGHSLYGDYPVLLHYRLLERHAHILGSSGSNKTSIGLAPLLSQIMAQHDSSVMIIDMKGDMSLFECARRECQYLGLPFRWFTNMKGQASYVFNPLDQTHLPLLSVNQRTQVSLQALSLDYGEDYGRGYYSALMESVFNAYIERFPDIRSFRDLSRYLIDKPSAQAAGLHERDLVNSKALEVTVKRLAELDVFNFKREDLAGKHDQDQRPLDLVYERRINLPDLLQTPQVVYFYLSAAPEPKTVSMMGKLALFTLLSAAAQAPEKHRKQVYIFADEFQRLMSQNLEIFFEQARSMKLSFILANQDLSQLRGKGVDILHLVESCTAFKQVFTAPDKDTVEMLSRFSGEGLFLQAGWQEMFDRRVDDRRDDTFSLKGATPSNPADLADVKVNEHSAPRLEINTIIEVSADQLGSFVRFAQSSGFTRFSGYVTPIFSEYHISEEEYKARASTPWPELTNDTVLVTVRRSEPKTSIGKALQGVKEEEPDTYDIENLEDKLDRALKARPGEAK